MMLIRALPLLALALLLAGCRHDLRPAPVPVAPVTVRVVAINDFHGYLEASQSPTLRTLTGDRDAVAGGVLALEGVVSRLRAEQPNLLLVGAGDLIGASPLTSALLHDEPTVEALGRIGLAVTAVGNHEFDRGLAELLRIQHGGCPEPGCAAGQAPFAGAGYQYLAANVFDADTGERVFPAWRIESVGGARVAFVGALTRDAPQVIIADAIVGLRFDDEADSINAVIPEILAEGVRAIVVLIHEGALPGETVDPATCAGLRGPLLDIADRLHPEVDAVVSGHTHRAYACRYNGRWLTQSGSYGHLVTAIDLQIDADGDVAGASVGQHVVDPQRAGDAPELQALIDDARARSATVAQQPIARLGVPQISRAQAANGESPLGRVIADAQLNAGRGHGAVFGCMNPGGVRQHLPAQPTDAPVTFNDVYAVQPFGNEVLVLEASGAEVLALLELQWQAEAPAVPLSCSLGFSYRFDPSRPHGERVLPGSVTIDGRPLDPQQRVRFTVNSFIAGGGDGLRVLTDLPRVAEAGRDLEALIEWLRLQEPLVPPDDVRAQRVP
jgi:5'-nucleotidase